MDGSAEICWTSVQLLNSLLQLSCLKDFSDMLIFLIGSKMDEEDLCDMTKDLPYRYTIRIFTTGMAN